MSAKTCKDAEDPWTDLNLDDAELQQLLDEPLKSVNKSVLRTDEQYDGFDDNVGDSWIYPSNMPMRDYQYNITQVALYRNTMVVLPTGLGKTFIAAVVMYNFYRWYPRGKVIFMAPTRPLVAQQIEACQKIMPFPYEDTAELTGKLNKKTRSELWHSKRVFFVTPQVVQSDIGGDLGAENEMADDSSLIFPLEQVKLLVVDEAHRAKGRYAYTEVTQAIWRRNRHFRVLALSATPGRTTEDVAEVIRNLFISHLEVRCDDSIDVRPYIHKRNMSTIVVPLSKEIEEIRDELLLIIDPNLRQLIEADVLSGSLTNISRNFLLFEQKRFRERSLRQRHPQQSMVTTNFSICVSLYHSLELLEHHGIRLFLNYFEEDEDGRAKFIVAMDKRLRNLIERVRREVAGPNPLDYSTHTMTNGEIAEIPKNLDFGHPKFEKARHCVLEHFQANPDSRVIVFCEYRESVMLVYRLLLQHRPVIRPRCFVGQGGNTGFLRALTQKQQLQIMADFRAGTSNTLIATSVGEEGIDVGEVDLIVCFDINTSNPMRFVQRIGRTGRQKQGSVVVLVTAGKEQAQLKEVLATKDQTNSRLLRSTVVSSALYKNSPRMIPAVFNPQCVKTFINLPVKQPEIKPKNTKAATKKSQKNPKTSSANQDLRKFFKRNVSTDSADFETGPTGSSQPAPSAGTQKTIEKSIEKVNKRFKGLDLVNIAPVATQTQCAEEIDPVKANVAPTISISDSESDSESLAIKKRNEEIDARLKKLEKFLSSDYANPTEKLVPLTREKLLKELKSTKNLKVTKRIALKMNPEFVRDINEKMKILLAVDGPVDGEEEREGSGNNDNGLYTAEEQEIRDTYQLMVNIFEGQKELEDFLEKLELETFKQKCDLPDEVLLAESDDEAENEMFKKRLDQAFKGVEERGFYHDNWDYIVEEYKKTNYFRELIAENDTNTKLNRGESMVFEATHYSSDDFSMQIDESPIKEDFSITESKYQNQWEELLEAKEQALNEDKENKEIQSAKEVWNGPKIMQQIESIKDHWKTDQSESKEIDRKEQVEDQDESKSVETEFKSYTQWEEFVQQQNQNKNSTKIQELSENVVTDKTESDETVETIEGTFVADQSANRTTIKKANCSPNESKLCSQWDEFLKANMRHNSTPLQNRPSLKTTNSTNRAIKNTTRCLSNFLERRQESQEANSKTQNTSQEASKGFRIAESEIIQGGDGHKDRDDEDGGGNNDSTPDGLEAFEFSGTAKSDEALNTNTQRRRKSHEQRNESTIAESMLENLDMDAFFEPFPEECLMNADSRVINESSCSENCETKKSETSDFTKRLTTSHPEDTHILKTPTKSTSQLMTSATKGANETSPSIFDIYLRSLRYLDRQKKQKEQQTTINSTSSSTPFTNSVSVSRSVPSKTIYSDNHDDDETIVINRPVPNSKRKIFDSDSEHEERDNLENVKSPEEVVTDCNENATSSEEIEDTQKQISLKRKRRQRRKRNPASSFFLQEAAFSDDDDSEGSLDHSDYDDTNFVAGSDAEEEDDNASRTRVHAMYLQSVRSPVNRCGAFKIPDFRVYNDHEEIFSQTIPVDNTTHYDSDFIVEETEEPADDAETTLCPLERAERILKKQKQKQRQERRQAQTAGVSGRKQRKKIRVLTDSSEEGEEA